MSTGIVVVIVVVIIVIALAIGVAATARRRRLQQQFGPEYDRLAREHDSTAAWWLQRPLIIGVSALFLVGLIAIFGRFERPRLQAR